MGLLDAPVAIAGVDGCRPGWVAVVRSPGFLPRCRVVGEFERLVDDLPPDAVVAVDMPIGLPARTLHGGRGPETLVRRHLGARQSSVFSIPSRQAVHAEPGPFADEEARYAAHRRASATARATSEPPRGISIQAFGLFHKIREIDALLRRRPELRTRLVESHPEFAFWRLNGETPMTLPKKIKGRVNPHGMNERRALLVRLGLHAAVLAGVPRGVGEDDLLDAAAMLFVAARHARGEAIPFPDPPGCDEFGIPIAIWS